MFLGMPLTQKCFPPSLPHTATHTLRDPSAQASASQMLEYTTCRTKTIRKVLEDLKPLTGLGPNFGNTLKGCLRISSESHYFPPKWNFSWEAIKMEGIKIFY